MTKLLQLSLLWNCFFQISGQFDRNPFSEAVQARNFDLYDAEDIRNQLLSWEQEYPGLIEVSTSQDSYGLTRAGTNADCPHEEGVKGCSNYYFVIQDFIAHPPGSASALSLPEIFWSGSTDGTDRTGPTVTMEAASLLLEAAWCESKPNHASDRAWQDELLEAVFCRRKLLAQGIDERRRKWLARLVSTRRIVVVPTPNALGFSRMEQEEGPIDPDQDFPYAQAQEQDSCMRSIAARTINEIFRKHMFQIALSFHTGPDFVAFSWGSEAWDQNMFSPDVKAQQQMAKAQEQALDRGRIRIAGKINQIINVPRQGVFEDWAYAGSWDTENTVSCQPWTYDGYSEETTKYNNSTNRAVALMVSGDASNQERLGTTMDLFLNDVEDILPRHMRKALASVDLVQPYVSILALEQTILSDDIVPLAERDGTKCKATNSVLMPASADHVEVEWTVGGGFDFSNVNLWHAKWSDFKEGGIDCISQPNFDVENDARFTRGSLMLDPATEMGYGAGMYSSRGPLPKASNSRTGSDNTLGPVFRGIVDLDTYEVGDEIIIIASARSDQAWRVPPLDHPFEPKEKPQSHLINARTNPTWKHEHEGKVIEGRLDWYSIPVTVVLADVAGKAGGVELYDRFQQDGIATGALDRNSAQHKLRKSGIVLGVLLVALAVFYVLLEASRSRKRSNSERLRKMVEEDASNNIQAIVYPEQEHRKFDVFNPSHDINVLTGADQFEDLQAASVRQPVDAPEIIDFEDDDSMIIFSDIHGDDIDKTESMAGFMA